jgi:cytolysin-activating lysine-acyltransferase
MLTKPQYTVQDWLDLHELTSEEVLDYCVVIRQKFQIGSRNEPRFRSKGLSFDMEQSLENLVLPALRDLLGAAASEAHDLSAVKIVKHKAGNLDLPFTEWDAKANAPAIHLVWSGREDDLICLAHEVAHAAQMILSKGAFMPPIAREACAFLGELALIRYAKSNSHAVYRELQSVWFHENQHYLGDDIAQLANDLKAGSPPYHYRHNYPLARVAAMAVFAKRGSDAIKKVFSIGANAMEALKLQDVIENLRTSVTIHANQANTSEADEDITAFRMSLSSQALQAVRTGEIDYGWLYRPANAGCVVEDIAHLPAQLWIKWRSLGVFALAALNRDEADILPSAFLEKHEQAATEPSELQFSAATPWVQPLKFDALTALGMTIQQLASSPYHQQFKLSYYLPVEILPPLKAEQFRCFLNAKGEARGLVTWAWLNDVAKKEVHTSGRALTISEWSSGPNLFFNDWITDPEIFRAAMIQMTHEVFPNETASSLRRKADGSVRRINKWTGRNLQKLQVATRLRNTNKATETVGG